MNSFDNYVVAAFARGDTGGYYLYLDNPISLPRARAMAEDVGGLLSLGGYGKTARGTNYFNALCRNLFWLGDECLEVV